MKILKDYNGQYTIVSIERGSDGTVFFFNMTMGAYRRPKRSEHHKLYKYGSLDIYVLSDCDDWQFLARLYAMRFPRIYNLSGEGDNE